MTEPSRHLAVITLREESLPPIFVCPFTPACPISRGRHWRTLLRRAGALQSTTNANSCWLGIKGVVSVSLLN